MKIINRNFFKKYIVTASSLLIAYTISPIYQLYANSLPLDERELWKANDFQLDTLEKKIITQLQLDPNSAFYHYLLTHVYIRKLENNPANYRILNKASELAQQTIELAPQSDYGYVAVAELLDLIGNSENALAMIEKVAQDKKINTWRFEFIRAKLTLSKDTKQESLEKFEKALKSPEVVHEAVIPYVAALLTSNQESNDIQNIEQWQKRYPSPILLHTLATKHMEMNNYKQANEIFETLYKNQVDIEAKINSAILMYSQLNQVDKSIQLFQESLEYKSNLSTESKATLYAHQGAALFINKKIKEASDSFINSMKLNNSPETISKFIDSKLRKIGKPNELVDVLKKINEQIPGKSVFHAYIGEIISEDLQHPKESLEFFNNAIILEPNKSEYYNAMGVAYYKQNILDQALKLFSTATVINPTDASAQYNEACVLAKLSQNEKALMALEKAINLDPSLINTAQNDPDFQNLHQIKSFQELIGTKKQLAH